MIWKLIKKWAQKFKKCPHCGGKLYGAGTIHICE